MRKHRRVSLEDRQQVICLEDLDISQSSCNNSNVREENLSQEQGQNIQINNLTKAERTILRAVIKNPKQKMRNVQTIELAKKK